MIPEKCPRCEKMKIEVVSNSPIEGAWELYLCETCKYMWRSTETEEMLTSMKLSEEEISAIPPVPPLKSL